MENRSCCGLLWLAIVLFVTLTVSANARTLELEGEDVPQNNEEAAVTDDRSKRAAVATAPGYGKPVIAVAGRTAKDVSRIMRKLGKSHSRRKSKHSIILNNQKKHHHRHHSASSSSSSSSSSSDSSSSHSSSSSSESTERRINLKPFGRHGTKAMVTLQSRNIALAPLTDKTKIPSF